MVKNDHFPLSLSLLIQSKIEYANLIKKMWTSSDGHSIVSPSSFKNTVGRFAPRFVGYAYVDNDEENLNLILFF